MAQVHGNSLFIFGGYNGQVVLNDFYEWRFQPLLVPPPTLQVSFCCVFEEKMRAARCPNRPTYYR